MSARTWRKGDPCTLLECKLVQPLWRTVERSSKKIKNRTTTHPNTHKGKTEVKINIKQQKKTGLAIERLKEGKCPSLYFLEFSKIAVLKIEFSDSWGQSPGYIHCNSRTVFIVTLRCYLSLLWCWHMCPRYKVVWENYLVSWLNSREWHQTSGRHGFFTARNW